MRVLFIVMLGVSMLITPAHAQKLDYQYCIIVHDSLVPAIEPLAEWKEQKGLSVFIATIESIEDQYEGRDRAERIRNFVKEKDSLWPGFQYLLLAGDTGTIPPRYVRLYYFWDWVDVPSDDYYTLLNTNWDLDDDNVWGEDSAGCSLGVDEIDFYDPHLFVGRLPSDNMQEMEVMVSKIINYEKYPSNEDWTKHLVLCAAIFRPNDSIDCISSSEYMLEEGFPGPENFEITRLYESFSEGYDSLGAESFMKALNSGAAIINDISHGEKQLFFWFEKSGEDWIPGDFVETHHIDTARNGSMLPMVMACACATACVDHTEKSLGEAFMTAPEGGSIIYFGSTRYDLPQAYCFYEPFFGEADRRAGIAWQLSKQEALDVFGPGQDPVYRFHYLQAIMFGDPELQINLSATNTQDIYLDKSTLSVHCYPNPANSLLNYKVSSHDRNIKLRVEIVDLFGRTIQLIEKKSMTGSMDLSGLHSGVYMIRFRIADEIVSKKIIKH
jgi:hypothetical protein